MTPGSTTYMVPRTSADSLEPGPLSWEEHLSMDGMAIPLVMSRMYCSTLSHGDSPGDRYSEKFAPRDLCSRRPVCTERGYERGFC